MQQHASIKTTDGELLRERVHHGADRARLHWAIAIAISREEQMPEKATIERARRDKREGEAASTQAGEFVREEMHHVREGREQGAPS